MKNQLKIYIAGVIASVAGAILCDMGVWATGLTVGFIGAMTLCGNAFDCFRQ